MAAAAAWGALQVIRCWASGPCSARLLVLLHAEDGESVALWGSVHAALAKAGGRAGGSAVSSTSERGQEEVRVASYQRAQQRSSGGVSGRCVAI